MWEPTPRRPEWVDIEQRADLERRLITQGDSLRKLMDEWEVLTSWAKKFPGEYIPREALLEELSEIHPLL